MESKEINIYPVPEECWWSNPDKRQLTTIPANNWTIKIEKCSSWEKSKNISWPWWKVKYKGVEINLFLSSQIMMMGYESSEEDNVLEFLLEIFNPETFINFNIAIEPVWKINYLGDGSLCNINQRRMSPSISIIDDWLSSGEREEFRKEIIKEAENIQDTSFLRREGIYELEFESKYKIKFDIKDDPTEYSFQIDVGIEEKQKPTSAVLLRKKLALIEALIIPTRLKWKEIINLLSKKPSLT